MARQPLESLHAGLRAWFESRFPALTEIQQRALRSTLRGRSTLILAPTGSGKTFSAFLSVLSNLATMASSTKGLPNAIVAVYVSPLKSLDRDIHRNLEAPLEAINATRPEARQIRMEIRTGDTEASE